MAFPLLKQYSNPTRIDPVYCERFTITSVREIIICDFLQRFNRVPNELDIRYLNSRILFIKK